MPGQRGGLDGALESALYIEGCGFSVGLIIWFADPQMCDNS